MSWIFVAAIAQFILGSAIVFDKYLLKKSYPNPIGYAFWIGALGALSIVLVPFGFEGVGLSTVMLAALAGSAFMLAMLVFMQALYYGEASGAIVVIAALSPIATLLFGMIILGTSLAPYQLVGFLFLIFAGLLLSLAAEKYRLKIFLLVLASAILFGFSNIITKVVFGETNFITGFILIKFSGALFVLLFLLRFKWREKIIGSGARDEFKNKLGYLLNRGYAALGSILIYYAIFLGPPSLVDATQTLRFLVVFLGGWLILRERFNGKVLLWKLVAFILIVIGILILSIGSYAKTPPIGITEDIQWGVAFSRIFAEEMGLDWREAYIAILDDLRPQSIRLPIYWTDVEEDRGVYNFEDYDWMINETANRNIGLILVVGRKLPRWPECHEPRWIKDKEMVERNEELLKYISTVVTRYKDKPNIYAWQVENEPFLLFGECPKLDAEFLDKEIALVRALDTNRPIIITDSGELSIWFSAYKRADIFGTTMYRIVWSDTFGHIKYPLPPKFFWLKTNLVRLFYPEKPIIVSELQAEPWGPKLIYETPLEFQALSMNMTQFRDNIQYARDVGFSEVYLWGAEWWYWMKEKHQRPEFWNTAKELMISDK